MPLQINNLLALVHAKTSPRQSHGRIIRGLPLFGCFVCSNHNLPDGTKVAKPMAYAEVDDKDDNKLWDCLYVYWVDVLCVFPAIAIIPGQWQNAILSCFFCLLAIVLVNSATSCIMAGIAFSDILLPSRLLCLG
jgi:hypothetical protein